MIVKYTNTTPTPHTVSICRVKTRRLGPRIQTLFAAWNIPYTREINPPKRLRRYTYWSDLVPRPKLLSPSGCLAATAPALLEHRLWTFLSDSNKKPPIRFVSEDVMTPQREEHRSLGN